MRLQPVILSLILSASAAFAADSALLNLVMPEARMVAGIDVERARDSYFGKLLLEQIDAKSGNDFAKFITATGFDPRRDLREILIATPDANTKNSPALMLFRGTFDTARIGTFLKASGIAPTENLGGIDFYTKPGAKDDSGFAIIDGNLAVAGNKDVVRAALQRRSGSSSALRAETYSKVQTMSKDNDIWMVSSIPVSEMSGALPGGGKQGPGGMMNGDAFKAIEQAAMGIRFGSASMDLMAETVSKTEKDATGVADVIRFLATMVQMNREKPEVQGLAAALDSMSLTTTARTTRLTISLPMAEIEKMVKQSGKAAPKKI